MAESPFKGRDRKGRVINDPNSVGWTITFQKGDGLAVQLSYFLLQERPDDEEVLERALKDMSKWANDYEVFARTAYVELTSQANRLAWNALPHVHQSDVRVLRASFGKEFLSEFASAVNDSD